MLTYSFYESNIDDVRRIQQKLIRFEVVTIPDLESEHQTVSQRTPNNTAEDKNMARLQRTVGTTFDAEIKMYEGVKYTSERGERITHEYKGIKFWEIVTDEDAEALEAESDGSCIDEYHEYLVLHFEDGDTATFRNSHVDMFRI